MAITATITKVDPLPNDWRVFIDFFNTVTSTTESRDYQWDYATTAERQAAADAIAAEMEAALAGEELDAVSLIGREGGDPTAVTLLYNTQDDLILFLAADLFNRMRVEYESPDKHDEILARKFALDFWTNAQIAGAIPGWLPGDANSARAGVDTLVVAVNNLDHGNGEIVI